MRWFPDSGFPPERGMMDKKQARVDLPSGKGTISTRAEQKQVEDRQAIGANVVYETIRREGEEELHRPAAALAWSALAAGLSMGFSFIAQGGTHGSLAGSAVATIDRRYRILCGIPHRHPGTPATLYGKHSDRSPASPNYGKICPHCCACFVCGSWYWARILLEHSCSLCASEESASSMRAPNSV